MSHFEDDEALFNNWVLSNTFPVWAPKELLLAIYGACGDVSFDEAPNYYKMLYIICKNEKMEKAWSGLKKLALEKYNKNPGNLTFHYHWEPFIHNFTYMLDGALNKDFRGSRPYRWDSLTPAEANSKRLEIAKKLNEVSRLLADYPIDSGLLECLEDDELQALYKNMNWHVRLNAINEAANTHDVGIINLVDETARIFEVLDSPINRIVIYCGKTIVPAAPDLSVILGRAALLYGGATVDTRLKTTAGDGKKVRDRFLMQTVLTYMLEQFEKPAYGLVAAIANTFGIEISKDQIKDMFKLYVSEFKSPTAPN